MNRMSIDHLTKAVNLVKFQILGYISKIAWREYRQRLTLGEDPSTLRDESDQQGHPKNISPKVGQLKPHCPVP